MKPLIAYLNFPGTCRQAMTFYKDCLGAELDLITFGEMPAPGLPEDARDKIMHARLHKGDTELMASDHIHGPLTPGANFSLTLRGTDLAECERLFAALSQGGTVTQPLMDAPWGAKFGTLTDQFGIQWMFNYELPK